MGKLADAGTKGTMKLPEMQNRLANFRLEKSDALKIAKELEKQGLIVLDMSKGVNQHLKIQVCSKGMANVLTAGFVILLYCVVLLMNVLGVYAVCP